VLDPLTAIASLAFTLGILDPSLVTPREVEFPFDDELRLNPGEANGGKVWRSRDLPYDGQAVPLVIFVHGIIFDGLRHHWLTTDPTGPWDARPFLSAMVDEGTIAPLVAASPSQTRDSTDPGRLFVDLDFDAFVGAVDRALAPHQRIDRARIVVVGHSGSACDPNGASFAALKAKTFTVRALFAVDGCMMAGGARTLASSTARDVFVTYQETIWTERPFADFRAAWAAELDHVWPKGLRVLERIEPLSENAHLALVEIALRRWLPAVLPPTDRIAWTASISRQLPTLPAIEAWL
jgi:hypothetical protein